ncbi:protein-glutamate methylesterase/protein-glutamine glutaminase [Methanothermococcus okinawensis]|uniref:Protein-glutamate methylesterase/protein-glutamine glutaminase n=1 Tax=Methanothermococcus okinawensis (strain DSM 14208 / JCM 11175 / IH1) TaxID=647113 RepID=F8AK24_METOI|nr:chemotaxis response regulator protein-glutamate methylesterase [Methanothermococcus okinawensis]AEH07385.1 response regulator receiver modulated CheB methylesterase [Methanothermococcus okinawensis IH1]
MKKIKVLVVDDSAFMRKIISDILNSDDDIEVIGTAKDGLEAVELTQKLNPNVITMDVEMPRMNGIEAVKKIMEIKPTPVLMISALTRKGSMATFEALEAGAIDFIQKPSGTISLDIRKVGDELIKKVKSVSKAYVRQKVSPPKNEKNEKIPENQNQKSKEENQNVGISKQVSAPDIKMPSEKLKNMAIMIGSSTGGPPVVSEIINNLPKNMPPIFVVQHMPKGFTKMFADRMNTGAKLNVKEAQDGELVKPDYVYVAPGDYQMLLRKRGNDVYIVLDGKMPKVHGTKPSVDVTAEYVSKIYGKNTVGVILTGIGRDGAYGLKLIKEKGGKIIAQNKDTCVVFGMPKAVIEMNIADAVLPPSKIPETIVKLIKNIGGVENG